MSEPHLAATCPVCGTAGYEARDPCPLHEAAHDMLAALEGLVRFSVFIDTLVAGRGEGAKEAIDDAIAAIAKARRCAGTKGGE